jgi:hypothetical protein
MTDQPTAAEAALARVRALVDEYPVAVDTALLHEALDEQSDPAAAEAQPASWLLAGSRDLNIPAPPVPCPACAHAGQAGLATDEQHLECVQEQP